MSLLKLSVAVGAYDRVQALLDGVEVIEGCDANFITLEPEEIFHRALRHVEFDVAELPLASYLLARAQGENPYIAIPVFVSRAFRHSAIYIRTDRGIAKPSDLKGRRVGVPVYAQTAGLWVRGMLNDDFGVDPREVQWVVGGLEAAGRRGNVSTPVASFISLEPLGGGETLSSALESGTLDAVISARPPSCFSRGVRSVDRLFPDFKQAERDYYERTRLFPIMHVLGIRMRLAEDNPWLPASVYKAFLAAKNRALVALQEITALKTSAPWLAADIQDTVAVMGPDFWPYGFESNRAAFAEVSRWFVEQGLTDRPLPLSEMFHVATLDSVKV